MTLQPSYLLRLLLFQVLFLYKLSLGNSLLDHMRNLNQRNIRDVDSARNSQNLLDMMETMLLAIDSRFKKMDTNDLTFRASMDQLSRKLDSLSQRINDNGDNVLALLNAIRALDNKLVFLGGNKPSGDALNSKLQDLNSKIDGLSSNLVQLKNEVVQKKQSPNNRDFVMLGSERRHIVTLPEGKSVQSINTDDKMKKELDSVKVTLRTMDGAMHQQMDKITSSISGLTKNVMDIKEAMLDSPDLANPTSTLSPNATDVLKNVTSSHPKLTKFEWLFRKLRPHLQITDRLDEIYTAMLNNRHTIEDTRQKSERLLSHSFHTAQTLNDVKNDIYFQTNKIMENLNQVEQWMKEQTGAASNLDPKFLHAGLKELLDKVDEEEKERVSQKLPEDFDEAPDLEAEFHKLNDGLATSKEALGGTDSFITYNYTTSKPFINASFDDICPFQEHPGINCADLKSRGVTKSGVYYILIKGTTYWFMKVYCEMEIAGGGWTVIQRRNDYGEPHESFNRDWNEYKNGFGDLTKEFWLGNENIFMLTNQDEYTLRIDLEDFDGNKRYAEYSKFKLSSEAENYKLEIGGYDGTAGDSLNDPWYGSNLSPFSTYNRDNDRSSLNCASMLRGGWWWRSCGRGLNGLYLTDPNDLAARQGIVWFRWRGWDYTLKLAQMMIRPKNFEPHELHTEEAKEVTTIPPEQNQTSSEA